MLFARLQSPRALIRKDLISMTIYCTYLTSYLGNKLPQFYIGSSSIDKIENGYHGSVKSKKYQKIWNDEIQHNQHLFKTKIISIHNSRHEALLKEKDLQVKLNAVKSPMYINESLAQINGFFGRDVSGKNNPAYNRSYKPTLETKNKLRKYHKENPKVWVNLNGISKHLHLSKLDEHILSGWSIGRGKLKRKKKIVSCSFGCCTLCKKELQINNLTNHYRFKHT